MKKLLFTAIMVLFLVGCSEETVDIEGEAVNYEELQGKISEAEKELEKVNTELKTNKDEYDELKQLAENRGQLETDIKDMESELAGLEENVEQAQDELEKINGEIVKVKDEPIKLNPGYYYFGSDIESGRYKMTAQEGQRGNVFVRGSSGSIVNEILGPGNDGHSISEFTFRAHDGEEIEATIPIYLYPVE